jgi:hypothetical protein
MKVLLLQGDPQTGQCDMPKQQGFSLFSEEERLTSTKGHIQDIQLAKVVYYSVAICRKELGFIAPPPSSR